MSNEELALAIQEGNTGLIPQLWEQTERFITKAARACYNRLGGLCAAAGVTVDDLCQEGYLALLDAVRAYDGRYKLVTYLKYPLLNRFNTALGRRQRRPNPLNQCTSLETAILGTDDLTIADSVPDPSAGEGFAEAEEGIYIQQLHMALEAAIDTLADQEQDIIRSEHFRGEPVKSIAARMGVSYSRCQQIRHQAYRGLRKPKATKHLKEYRQNIIDHTAYQGGLGSFRNTFTSSTELAVLRLERLGM